MKRLFYLMLTLPALFLTACNRTDEAAAKEEMLQRDGIYMVRGGEDLFVYKENTCQWSWQAASGVYRMFDDEMKGWFKMDCQRAVLTEGTRFNANLEWTTSNNVGSLKNVSLELLKIKNGLCYFWGSAQKIGLCLPIEAL